MNEPTTSTEPTDAEEDEQQYDEQDVDSSIKIAMICIYVIILMLSLVGSSLIIHLVRTRKNIRKKQFYWLIFNTAVADLIDVLTACAFSMPYFMFGDRWGLGGFGTAMCKIIPFLLVVSICAAIWTLTVIAVDRYLVIVCLRRRALSSRSVLRSIIIVWLCAIVVGSGQLYKYRTVEEDGIQYCVDEWDEDSVETSMLLYKTEMLVTVITAYAVPLVIMAILYFLIARFLWTHKPPVSVNQHAYINQARKRKTTIKMFTVVTVPAVCWFPVHFGHIRREFYTQVYYDTPSVLRWLLFWLAHVSAAIHPWLFIAFGDHLRRGTKEVYRHLLNKLRLCTGSTLNPVTNDNPPPRGVTPKGHGRTAEQDA